MALRSLIISFLVTGLLGYSLTVGLTDPDSFLKKIPDLVIIPLLVAFVLLYLLAAWWAFQGFHAHKFAAIISLGFCAFGLGLYGIGFSMEMTRGKAAPGQYDYDFSGLDPAEKDAISQIVQAAGMSLENAEFTEHWHAADSTKTFRICVQKGHITALNLSNHPVKNLAPISGLKKLGDLYLKNCDLVDMSALKSEKLERLDVSGNQITDLKTLSGCPNIRWLFASNNQLKSTDGVERFGQMVSQDFSGNPLIKTQ
jgi:Leucine-rich repeat (LRR) protein